MVKKNGDNQGDSSHYLPKYSRKHFGILQPKKSRGHNSYENVAMVKYKLPEIDRFVELAPPILTANSA